jgi:hypothetical protein
MEHSTEKYIFKFDDILNDDMYNCNIEEIKNAPFLIVDKFYFPNGAFVKEGEIVLKISCDFFDNKKFFLLRAIQDGYIDFYIPESPTVEKTYLIIEDIELYYIYKSKVIKYFNIPEVKIDKFTKNKSISWLLVGGIDRYSTPATGIHVKMEKDKSLHFSIEHYDKTNYIVFTFSQNEISIGNLSHIIFLFENDRTIKFNIEAKSRENGIIKLYCRLTQDNVNFLINYDLIGIRIQTTNPLIKIDSKGFDPWYDNNIKFVLINYIASFIKTLEEESIEIIEDNFHYTDNNEKCYVYLMQDLSNGFFKIGISNKPTYREETLQSEKPTIELLEKKQFPNRKIAKLIEKSLHEAYSEYRIRGEWFDLSYEDVVAIQETLST